MDFSDNLDSPYVERNFIEDYLFDKTRKKSIFQGIGIKVAISDRDQKLAKAKASFPFRRSSLIEMPLLTCKTLKVFGQFSKVTGSNTHAFSIELLLVISSVTFC